MLRIISTLLFLLPLRGYGFTLNSPITSSEISLKNAIGKSAIDRTKSFTLQMAGNSREEEIAALEEKLRQLKEEAETGEEEEETKWEITEEDKASSGQQYLGRLTPSVKSPMEEMLSESWKEGSQADSSNGNSFIDGAKNIVGAVIFVVVLALASQIPVGQEDFSKYSYKTPASPSTSIDLGDLNPVKTVKNSVFSAEEVTLANSEESSVESTD